MDCKSVKPGVQIPPVAPVIQKFTYFGQIIC